MKSALLILAMLTSCASAELTMTALTKGLQANQEPFEKLTPGKDGEPKAFDIKLGDTIAKVEDAVFDGFRFRYPEDAEGDFVWYFNAPGSWGNWYILPVEGDATQAFKGWLDGDKLYTPFDKGKEKGRTRILQTLSGSYFKKGAEYILWFRRTEGEENGSVRGVMAFCKTQEKWDYEPIEKALQLKLAPVEDQVAELNSRGGLILLDDHFFNRGDAENRVDSVFSNIRRTQNLRGGFFITIKEMVPPCGTSPSIDEIIAKHGAPDFIRTSKEDTQRSKDAGNENEEDPDTTTYFYDRFGFEVSNSAKPRVVERVTTQAEDFSVLAPPKEGNSYASVPMEKLTVFHSGGKEVGRAYQFMEDGDKPTFVTEPPVGTYKGKKTSLTYKGAGEWTFEAYYEDGKLAQRTPLSGDRFNGEGEGYYPNGKKRYTAPYKDGVLEGEVVQYDEGGKEKGRRKFKDGEEE